MKVLLVDDSPVSQLATSALLAELGIEHVSAENGLMALNLLMDDKVGDIGLILMDCHMPKINGFKATKLIRRGYAGPAHSFTPVVALTASADHEDKLLCLEVGMNGLLTKPVDPVELGSTIAEYLD